MERRFCIICNKKFDLANLGVVNKKKGASQSHSEIQSWQFDGMGTALGDS